jgi:chromosome segregation ATPase
MRTPHAILFSATLLIFAVSTTTQAQISATSGNDPRTASSGKAASGGTGTAGIEDNVKALQASIKEATDRLQKAGASTTEKVKELDALTQTVSASLKEVSAGGGLHTEIQKTIQSTKAKVKEFHDLVIAPDTDAEERDQYKKLENRFTEQADKLYRASMALEDQRVDLEKTLRRVEGKKKLIAHLLAAQDVDAANEKLLEVVKNMSSLNQSFGSLLENIVSKGIPEKTQ